MADSLAYALKSARFIRKINFRNCGLTDETFLTILNALDRFSLNEIDIGLNPCLTSKSYDALAELILEKASSITVLNLDSNQMGDTNLAKLTDALAQVNYIEQLDVSNNKISNDGALKIAYMMSQTNNLRVLMMKFNSVMGKGGQAIANEIRTAEKIQVFDISFNAVTGLGKVPQQPELQKVEIARERYEYEAAKLEASKSKVKDNVPKKAKA